MSLTIEKVLRISPMRNHARLVAGKEKISNQVTGVTIIESPDIVNWLRGGELLFTSLYPFQEDLAAEQELIVKLVEKEASGLIVKVHRFVDEVPREIIETANTFQLPVIALEGDIRYVDAIHPIMAELFNKQVRILNYYKEVHDRFTSLALAGEGPSEVIASLEELIDNPVAVYDKNYNCLAATQEGLCNFEETGEDNCLYSPINMNKQLYFYRRTVLYPQLGKKPVRQVVVPIKYLNQLHAYLVVVELNRSLEKLDMISLEHAATVICLEMVKRMAVAEVERRFKNDLIHDIIYARFSMPEIIYERADMIGWDLRKPFRVVIFEIENLNNYILDSGDKEGIIAQKLKGEISSLITNALFGLLNGNYIIGNHSESFIVFYPVEDGHSDADDLLTIKKIGQQVKVKLEKQYPRLNLSVGMGSTASYLEELPRSYQEAKDAIAFGRLIHGGEVVVGFQELGVYRILCQLVEKGWKPEEFVPQALHALIAYDEQYNSNLLQTLEVLLECNGNASKAAKKLYIHYKTMLYRIERIKAVTGLDLDNRENRLELEMGLKIYHLVKNRR